MTDRKYNISFTNIEKLITHCLVNLDKRKRDFRFGIILRVEFSLYCGIELTVRHFRNGLG